MIKKRMFSPSRGTKIDNLNSDIVVVGGGGAGLAAAVAAGEMGAKVIVLEKRRVAGGNASMAEGFFGAGSPVQQRNMVDADPEGLFRRAMDYYHWTVDPGIMRAYINKSGDTVRWLEEKGLEFELAPTMRNQLPLVWHVLPRRGAAIMKVLLGNCRELGVKVLLDTAAAKLMTGASGSVNRVMARDKEKEIEIPTASVVIATGGFGGNQELLQKYFPYDTTNLICNGLPHMGDGILMAWEAGAASEGLGNMVGGGPGLTRKRRGAGPAWSLKMTAVADEPNMLWVNKNGVRFTDECITFNVFEVVNPLLRQPDMAAYSLFDDRIRRDIAEKGLIRGIGIYFVPPGSRLPDLGNMLRTEAENGTAKTAGTWDEIAAWMGADPAVLRATVDEYNAACDKGYDDVFYKDRRYLQALRTPPYHAVVGHPFFTTTIGGIKINQNMEVLDGRGAVIRGLYAAGVDAGGWVSGTYCAHLAGSAFGFALNSGRIAAENAVKYARGG
jgi:fumarate reductase flavoprotein subunit